MNKLALFILLIYTAFKKKKKYKVQLEQNWIIHRKLRFPKAEGSVLFFDTCSNVGHLLQYNFKTLLLHFPRNSNHKMTTILFLELCETSFIISVKFFPSERVRI
jgi:hypothetical protein